MIQNYAANHLDRDHFALPITWGWGGKGGGRGGAGGGATRLKGGE